MQSVLKDYYIPLSESQQYIYNLLTTRLKFNDQEFEYEDFEVDLVIKIDVPTLDTPRQYANSFNKLFFNTSVDLEIIYSSIIATIKKNQVSLGETEKSKLFTTSSFYPLSIPKSKPRKIRTEDDYEYEMEFLCDYQFMPQLDLFTLRYNTIVYLLQNQAGFKVKSFLLNVSGLTNPRTKKPYSQTDKAVFMLLRQSVHNLLKIADRYHIKKYVDYTQLDFFLNDPTDSSYRPIRHNSAIKNANLGQTDKKIMRKYHLQDHNTNKLIIEESSLSDREIAAYLEYKNKVVEECRKINYLRIELTDSYKIYLFYINRGKINPGCDKYYVLRKKRRLIFEKLRYLGANHSYPCHKEPISFFYFRLPNKKKSFFYRLRSMLFYKYMKISPYGKLSLFLKMYRIKLSYLTIKEFFKIYDLRRMGCDIFALSDDFEKFGIVPYSPNYNPSQKNISTQVYIIGGIDGDNLSNAWSPWQPWFCSITTIRNYLGYQISYNILIKNHLILYFFILSPFAVAVYVLLNIYIPRTLKYIFYLGWLLVSVAIYSVFLDRWAFKYYQFLNNFVEDNGHQTFREDYNGPFVRNYVTDALNYFSTYETIVTSVKGFLSFLLISIVLFIEGCVFLGVRYLIIAIFAYFPAITFYIISLPHLLCYFAFFWTIHMLDHFVINRMLVLLTDWRNIPTHYAYQKAIQNQIYFMTVGLELIGPLFLLLIEPFYATSCFASECINYYTTYIYSRYIIVFMFLCYNVLRVSSLLIVSKFKYYSNDSYDSYQLRINKFLERICNYSNKDYIVTSLREDTIALLHHSLFTVIFPFSSVLGLGCVLIDYMFLRLYILNRCRRPISRSYPIYLYSYNYALALHISIFVNCWMIVFTDETLEYNYPAVILYFLPNPNAQQIMLFKMLVVAALIVIYEIISLLIRLITQTVNTHILEARKKAKHKEYMRLRMTTRSTINLNQYKPIPLKTIFRVFNDEESPEVKVHKILNESNLSKLYKHE